MPVYTTGQNVYSFADSLICVPAGALIIPHLESNVNLYEKSFHLDITGGIKLNHQ